MSADSPLLPYLMSPLRMTLILRGGCCLIIADSLLLLSSALRVTSRSRGCCSTKKWHLLLDSTWLPAAARNFAGDLPAVNKIPAVRHFYLALYAPIVFWGLSPLTIVVHLTLCAPFVLLCYPELASSLPWPPEEGLSPSLWPLLMMLVHL